MAFLVKNVGGIGCVSHPGGNMSRDVTRTRYDDDATMVPMFMAGVINDILKIRSFYAT